MPHRSVPGLVLLMVLVAGCGAAVAAPADPPPPVVASKAMGMPCHPVPEEPGEVVYEGFGVRTLPAPAGTPTTVTAAAVLAGPDATSWGPGTSQDAELRLVTTGDFGCRPDPKGVVRQPGWVVTIHGTVGVRYGPPPPSPPPTVLCTSVVIVDAADGVLLSNFQTCGG